MGNKQAAKPANPWASVAKATVDERNKDGRAANGESKTFQVNTTATKLPANLVYSSLVLDAEGTLSFDLVISEACIVDTVLNDHLIEHARQTLLPGKSKYSQKLTFDQPESRIVINAKGSGATADGPELKVTLLAKGGKLLVLSKQAEIGGKVVDLEEVYGLGSAKECVICITETSNTTFVPCRHMCACEECASMLMQAPPGERKCPICRALISSMVKVNTSSAS